MNTTLPVVAINEPCPMDWSAMTPVDARGMVRHCSVCDLNVHNISAMTDREAMRFVERSKTEHVCGRMNVASDGRLITQDTGKARRLWPAAVAIGVSLAAGTAVTAQNGPQPAVAGKIQVVMGDVALPAQALKAFDPHKHALPENATRLVGTPAAALPAWIQKLIKDLPADIVPLTLGEASYPLGLPAARGTVYLFGNAGNGEKPDDVRLVIWQMPAGYVAASPVTPETLPTVQRVISRNDEGDFLTWGAGDQGTLIDQAAGVFNGPATRPSGDEPMQDTTVRID